MSYMRDLDGRRLDAISVIGTRHLTSLRQLPALVSNTYLGYNGGQNLITARGYQYAVFVRNDMHAVICQRAVGAKTWSTTTDLFPIFGTQVLDGHNYYSIAVDATGYIHVAGNMHNNAIKYARSNTADSIAAFTKITSMTGVNENSVTYPTWLTVGTKLLFVYRNGVSGDGSLYMKRYDPATTTFTDIGIILDGVTSVESPYTSLVMTSQDGSKVGLAFLWRGSSGSADTNADVCYIETTDLVNFASWKDASGSPVALPLLHAGSPKAFPTAATGSGLLNSPNLDFDTAGHPHLVFLLYDGSGNTNVKHVWWDGAAWQNEFVTFGTRRMSTSTSILDGTVGRPGIVCTKNGGVFVIWRTSGDGGRGVARVIDITTPGSPFEFSLANLDVGYQEFLWFDFDAVRSQNRLDILLSPQPFAQYQQGDYGDDVNWSAQWGAILTVDPSRMRQLASAQSNRAKLRTVATAQATSATFSASGTAWSDLSGAPVLPVDLTWAADGRLALVRLVGAASKATAGSGSWAVTQRDRSGGQITTLASFTVTQASSNLYGVAAPVPFVTPWVPIDMVKIAAGGTLQIQGKSSDGNSTTLANVSVQVALVEDTDGTLLGAASPTGAALALPAEDAAVTAVTTAALWADWDAGQLRGTDGSAVTQWLDRSGNGRHMTPILNASGALLCPVPTFLNAGIGGQPALVFSGAAAIAALLSTPATFTIVAVLQQTTVTAASQSILMADDTAQANSAGRAWQMNYAANGSPATLAAFNTANSAFSDTEPVSSPTSASIISAVRGNTAMEVFVNGVSTSGTTATTGSAAARTAVPVVAGARRVGDVISAYLTGKIARLIIFSAGVNATERHALEAALATKYGITLAG